MSKTETPDARRRRVAYLKKQAEEAEAIAARLKLEQVEKLFAQEQRRQLRGTLTHSLGDALRAKGLAP